jgi:hypothetical protein
MVHGPAAGLLTDHVALTPLDGVGYVAAAVLWLVGVAIVVALKLRATR